MGTARWTGTPLAPPLREAGLPASAVDVVFTGADHGIERGVEQDYQCSLSVADALSDDVLLAYEMNDAPLPPQHGYPLRLVVPGWYGMAHVKWLVGITAAADHFDGYQMGAYRVREKPEDQATPLTRIEPRALLMPPGFPDFMSRSRVVRAGTVTLEGRAWSGWAPIDAVDVTVDGGDTWALATREPAADCSGWARWTWAWEATVGSYLLGARAHDESGRSQPVDAPWNRGGFANNSIQRVPVSVIN